MSSGMKSLFSLVAFFVAACGGLAFGLQNKEIIRNTFFALTGVKLEIPVDGTPMARSFPLQASQARLGSGDVALRAGPGGHFETTAEINGRSVEVLVDTGATMVALTYEDAERAGIYLKPSDYTYRTMTANGIAKVAPVTISTISIGNITVRNIQGAVSERGKLSKTLLGMSFLQRLSRVEMQRGALVLHE